MITIHTLREATKTGQQKRREEARIKANVWICETLLPELLEIAKLGEFKHYVVFPKSLESTAVTAVLKEMGFQCEGIDDDDLRYDTNKHECYQAVVRWL